MSYPASVEQVTSSRLRQKQSKSRRRQLEGDDTPYDDDVDVGVGLGGPVLDFGREGAVKLHPGKGGWEWTWLNQKGNEDLLTSAEGVLLYPACRTPDVDLEDIPASKVADSAVDYVRSLPDISEYASISDLIMDELAEKPTTSRPDSYRGSILSVIVNAKAKSARALLAFPAGPVGCQLNISPFLPKSDAKRHQPYLTTFRPDSQPVEMFPTQILQLCSSPYMSGSKIDREMTALLVRTHLTTYMLNVSPHRVTCTNEDSAVETLRVGQLSHTDTEGRRHVDMVLNLTSWSKALIVDEGGGVWLWWEQKIEVRERLVKTMKLRKIRDAVSQERHGFYRIAFGTRPGTVVVMSSRQLTVIEHESDKSSETVIMSLSGVGRTFTALETTSYVRNATYTCVATNHEVMWVDELSPGPPVLTWRHDLAGGEISDLQLQVINGPSSEYTLLSSPDTPLIMVYDVPSSPPAHTRGSPRCLALPRADGQPPLISLQRLDLGGKGKTSGVDTHLVALDGAGAVQSFDMEDWTTSDADGMDVEGDLVMGKQHPGPVWNQAIRSMAEGDRGSLGEKPWSEKAKTKHKVFDLRDMWLELNGDEPDHDTMFNLEAIEQHLRERDAPLESFVTLGDLARDAISEQDAGRTHALLPLDIDADAFASDLVSLGTIDTTKHELHQAAVPPTEHLIGVSGTSKDPMSDLYATFAQSPVIPFTDAQTRYQRDTRRLVLDLTLSRMVVHSEELDTGSRNSVRASQEPSTADDLFERAGQLTLNDENDSRPVPPTFQWLPPRRGFDQDLASRDVQPTESDLDSPTARALLGDWKIGTDPTQFTWKDWRRETSAVPTPVRRPVRPLPSPRTTATQTFAQSQLDSRYRPPTIAQPQPRAQWGLHTSNSIPNILAHGQGTRSSPPPVLHSSQSYQDLGGNTQAEAGKFGGRLDSKSRKKVAKKRVGGF